MVFFTLLATVLVPVVSWYLWTYLTSPLRCFPGHWSTAYSNLWRFFNVLSRKPHLSHLKLHEQHGSAVRMGPNVVSLSDPAVIPEVFRSRNPWHKTAFYSVNDVMVQGQRISNMFGTLNEDWHSTVTRPVKGLYSMTRALDVEVHITATIKQFTEVLDERFIQTGKACDIAEYIPFFAWDCMGTLTFGKSYGMMESGKDNGLINTSTKGLDYFAPVTQIPTLDLLLDKNPIKRIGPPSFMWATIQAYGAVAERNADRAAATEEKPVNRQSDFLDKFLAAKQEYPDLVNDDLVVNYLLVNVIAGSDTTANQMSGALYYILKTPGCLQRLQKELDAAAVDPEEPVSWKDIQKLPYFDAVMKETQRIHPGTGLMLERVVPSEGFALPDGRFLPAGTIVGVNSWVMNRNKDVFGDDANDFVPDRWLRAAGEEDEKYQARLRKMNSAIMTFGAGKRACIGKNVAMLTAYKLVATLVNKYDIALVDLKHEWTVKNSWFVYNYDIPVTVKLRGQANGSANGVH